MEEDRSSFKSLGGKYTGKNLQEGLLVDGRALLYNVENTGVTTRCLTGSAQNRDQ